MWWQLLLLAAVLWVAQRRWSLRRQRAVGKLLQTNIKAWPILGHTYMFIGSQEKKMESVQKMAKDAVEAGGISKFMYFDQILINIADPIIIQTVMKECLEKHDIMKLIAQIASSSSFIAPVPIWRLRRKMMTPSFSTRDLIQYCRVFSEHGTKLVDLLEQEMNKGAFSFWDYMISFSFDSVCETTMGVKIKSQSQFLHAIEELWDLGSQAVMKPWVTLFWRIRAPHLLKYYNYKTIAREFIKYIINEKKNEIKLKTTGTDNTFTTAPKSCSYLERQLLAPEHQRLTNEALLDECLTIIVAGFDTTAISGSFVILLLSRHPDIQDKVYNELYEVFGESDRPVSYENLLQLKYLEIVIKETIRLYPAVPLIGRTAQDDVKLPSGLTIVKDCGVLINIWGAHRNPAYWGADADLFRPERFLDNSLKHPEAFMPFGSGPRNCIGSQYAMLSLKSMLSSVLRRYRVLPPPGVAAGDMPRPSFNMILKHADNYLIRIQSRK